MKITLKDINKVYKSRGGDVAALSNINLDLSGKREVVISGSTGSGKTTLLYLIGLINRDYIGEYMLDDMDMRRLSGRKLSRFRNKIFGYIFQEYALIEEDTCYENVLLPLLYSGKKIKNKRQRVEDILEKVGLSEKVNVKVRELSGGQRQRVAIARALVHEPSIILADEMTSALDAATKKIIMDVLYDYVDSDESKMLIMVSHEPEAIKREGQLHVVLEKGEVVGTAVY